MQNWITDLPRITRRPTESAAFDTRPCPYPLGTIRAGLTTGVILALASPGCRIALLAITTVIRIKPATGLAAPIHATGSLGAYVIVCTRALTCGRIAITHLAASGL